MCPFPRIKVHSCPNIGTQGASQRNPTSTLFEASEGRTVCPPEEGEHPIQRLASPSGRETQAGRIQSVLPGYKAPFIHLALALSHSQPEEEGTGPMGPLLMPGN